MVVPDETAVTTPLLSIVATVEFEEVQGVVASGVPDPVKVDVDPLQIVVVPAIVGLLLTVTTTVF